MSVRIQLRGPDNSRHILTISESTTLPELLSHAARLFSSSVTRPELLAGFPPAPLTDPSPAGGSVLAALSPPIKTGSALVVQEAPAADGGAGSSAGPRVTEVLEGGEWKRPPVLTQQALAPGGKGAMVRVCMPSDNSCLFHALRFLIKGDLPNHISPQITRSDVAEAVSSPSSPYTDAILGAPKQQYLLELRNPSTWGGAIECVVLADVYRIEIVILDYFSLSEHIIGAGRGYPRRVYILYRGAGDGSHYDAVAFAPSGSSPLEDKWRNAHTQDIPESAAPSLLPHPASSVVPASAAGAEGVSLQLSFAPTDSVAANEARKIAEALHRSAASQGRCAKVDGWKQGQIHSKEAGSSTSVVGGVVVNKNKAGVTEHVIPPTAAPAVIPAPAAASPAAAPAAAPASAPAPAPASVHDDDDDDGVPTAPVSKKPNPTSGSAGEKRDDLWTCETCTYANLPLAPQCGMCAATNPVYLQALEAENNSSAPGASSVSSGSASGTQGSSGGNGNGWVDGVRPADQTRRMRLMDDFDTPVVSRAPAPAPAPAVRRATRGFSCPVCTLWNEAGASECEACGNPPPADALGSSASAPAASSSSSSSSAAAAAADRRGRRLGDDDSYGGYGGGSFVPAQSDVWQCERCAEIHPADTAMCRLCGAKNEELARRQAESGCSIQ